MRQLLLSSIVELMNVASNFKIALIEIQELLYVLIQELEKKEKFWQEAKKLKRPIQMDYYKDKLEKPLDYPNSQYNFFGGNNWVTWLKQA